MLFLLSTGLDTDMISILLRHTKSYQNKIILNVPTSVNAKHVHKFPKFPFWEWKAFGVLWSRIIISQQLCVPAVPVSHLVTNLYPLSILHPDSSHSPCSLCDTQRPYWDSLLPYPYPPNLWDSPCHNHRLCCLRFQSIAYAFTDSYPLAFGLTAHTVLHVAWSLGGQEAAFQLYLSGGNGRGQRRKQWQKMNTTKQMNFVSFAT